MNKAKVTFTLIIAAFLLTGCSAITGMKYYTSQVMSMEPTIKVGQEVQIDCRYSELERSDIVMIERPSPSTGVKKINTFTRIIGLPGERIKMLDGNVYINGKLLSEKYVKEKGESTLKEISVPSDKYYVLSDNRPNAMDSRVFGPIKKDSIIGKADL